MFAQQPRAQNSTLLPEGIWESSDGKGGAVGINLSALSSSLNPPLSNIQIGVYERYGKSVQCGEENFFETASKEGDDARVRSQYSDGVLTVVYPQFTNEAAIDIDLRWEPRRGVWRGRFHRGTFDRVLTLRRVAERGDHDQSICGAPGNGYVIGSGVPALPPLK